MSEQHVARLSLRDQVLAILRKRLVTGELRPDSLYSAAAISSELGVSTSPVREAMITLVNQGVLEAVRNRGFRVVPMTSQDRRDVHELRTLVEIPAMVKLAGHPSVGQHEAKLREIAAENVAAAAAGDLVAYLETDMRFHIGLLELWGNDRLATLVASLRDQTRRVGLTHLARSGTLLRTAEEHQLLLDALLEGDAELVRTLMDTHLGHINRDWGPADSPGASESHLPAPAEEAPRAVTGYKAQPPVLAV